MMTPTWLPFEFVRSSDGAFLARNWVRPGEGMFKEVEGFGQKYADFFKTGIDILECTVMPSGAIGSRERIGMRMMPS
jgi:hypothetical protein